MGSTTKDQTIGNASSRVFTIGHSTRDLGEVLAMLRANGVSTLVDVRSYPSSRKFPQWNQDAIKDALPADIGYRWIRDLGGRRHTPAGVASPNGEVPQGKWTGYAAEAAVDEANSKRIGLT